MVDVITVKHEKVLSTYGMSAYLWHKKLEDYYRQFGQIVQSQMYETEEQKQYRIKGIKPDRVTYGVTISYIPYGSSPVLTPEEIHEIDKMITPSSVESLPAFTHDTLPSQPKGNLSSLLPLGLVMLMVLK